MSAASFDTTLKFIYRITKSQGRTPAAAIACLLYTSDAADDLLCVDLGGRRIIKKKKTNKQQLKTYEIQHQNIQHPTIDIRSTNTPTATCDPH